MTKKEYFKGRRFIYNDIRREIRLAEVTERIQGKAILKQLRIPRGGGNFLAALGLLCYTEFAGKEKYKCKKKNGTDHANKNFNKYFDELGKDYKAFRASGVNVYNIFRCGLAHEYFVKDNCTIFMKNRVPGPGIGRDKEGKYYFVVETYFRDFMNAYKGLGAYLFP
jgi:hypothetical protein